MLIFADQHFDKNFSIALAFATKKFAPSFFMVVSSPSEPTKNEKAPLKTFLRSSSSYEISSHEVLPPLCRVPAPPTQCCLYFFLFALTYILSFLCLCFEHRLKILTYIYHFLHIYLLFLKIGMHSEIFQASNVLASCFL